MTELEWLIGAAPAAMLAEVSGRVSARKLRLYACACVRRYEDLLRYAGPRDAMQLAVRVAEGQATEEEREAMRLQAEQWAWNAPEFDQPTYQAVSAALLEDAAEAATQVTTLILTQAMNDALNSRPWVRDLASVREEARSNEALALGWVAQEIFGNPFRPVEEVEVWRAWGDGVVRKMAQSIEAESRYAELPYLADALVDAGCTWEEMVRHLRERRGHRRGCWALDLLVGKE